MSCCLGSVLTPSPQTSNQENEQSTFSSLPGPNDLVREGRPRPYHAGEGSKGIEPRTGPSKHAVAPTQASPITQGEGMKSNLEMTRDPLRAQVRIQVREGSPRPHHGGEAAAATDG